MFVRDRGKGVLANLKLWPAEIQEQAMLDPRRPQITKYLSDMFCREGLARLQLDNNNSFDQEVGEIVSNHSAILVVNCQRMLLLHFEAQFPQSMNQRVFVNLLQVAALMVAMNCKCCFAN